MAGCSFLLLFLLVSLLACNSYSSDGSLAPILEALTSSGYSSMTLTLQLAPESLVPHTSGTIFAPSDAAFLFSGQISLRLLRYHVSPHNLFPANLLSLPPGAHITTLLPERYLVITDNSTINGIKIESSSPIYRNPGFTVYGIERFFNPASPACMPLAVRRESVFRRPIQVLASRGFEIFASLLDLQALAFHDRDDGSGLTVFAVPDKVIPQSLAGNLTQLAWVLRRHVVPCRVSWTDIEAFGGVFVTLDEQFLVNLTRSGVDMMANGANIVFPDMYSGDSVVVHGLGGVFPVEFSAAGETKAIGLAGADM